jgi:polyhydroxyalkanoate synthesis repressor PhaR
MITIKKYSNRRLYDTSRSEYVNLEDLAEIIRRGDSVRVLDAKTDEDLTRSVLLQVAMELPGVIDVLPPALLHRIIRITVGQPMTPMLIKQLAAGLELLETQLAAFEQQFGWSNFAASPPPPPYDTSGAGGRARGGAAPPPSHGPDEDDDAPPPRGPPRSAAPDPELDALRRRLQEIEARLKRGT